MRIGMVLWHTFPHDVRIQKEAKSLRAAGHEVVLLCLGTGDEPARERVGAVDVCRVNLGERFGLPRRTVARLGYAATGRHHTWKRAMSDVLLDGVGVDCLHVHDLPLTDTAIRLGRERDVPVVADLHENYPEAVRQWRTAMSRTERLKGDLFNPIWRLKRREKRVVRRADAILCITAEGKRHYVDCGGDPDRIHVVSNTVDLDAFDPDRVAPVDGYGDEFVVGYVGSFGPHRGLETAIDAFPRLLAARSDARLLLVGAASDEAYEESLRDRCERLGVADRVSFTGWVDIDEVPNYVAACDVPFVLHADNPHTGTTVPHKLFQYMALGKPPVVTSVDPLARPVEQYDAGAVVEPGDADGFADAVVAFGSDSDRYERAARNARRAVEVEYNWERDGTRLQTVYDRLIE